MFRSKKKPRKNYFKELRILRWDYPGFMGPKWITSDLLRESRERFDAEEEKVM